MASERRSYRVARRTFIKFGAITLAGLAPVLVACGSQPAAPPTQAPAPAQAPAATTAPQPTPAVQATATAAPAATAVPAAKSTVPVNVVVWDYKPEIIQDNLTKWATEYNQPKPNFAAIGGVYDYANVITTKFIGGERIDFLYSHEDTVNKWYKPGWIRAVGDFDWVKQELLPLEYDWGKKNQTGFDGKLVGLPYWAGGRELFINTEVANKVGVKPATTWSEFMSQLELAKSKGIQYPLSPTWAKDFWNMGLSVFSEAYSDGAYIFKSPDSSELDLRNEGFKSLMDRWKEISDKKYVPGDALTNSSTAGGAPTSFSGGLFLYGWADDYNGKDWQDPKASKIVGKYTNLLNPGKTHETFLVSPMYCLGAQHDISDDVLSSLARFYAYKDPQTKQYMVGKRWGLVAGLGTNNKEIMNDPEIVTSWKEWRNVDTYNQIFTLGKPKEGQKQLWYPEWEVSFLTDIQNLITGKIDFEKLVKNSEDNQKGLMDQYPKL